MSHNEKVNRAAREKWNRKKRERNEEDGRIYLKLASFQTEACDGKENVDIHSINKFLVVPGKGCEEKGLLLSYTYLPTSSIFCTQNSHQKYNYIITQFNEYTYVYISTLCYGRYKDK